MSRSVKLVPLLVAALVCCGIVSARLALAYNYRSCTFQVGVGSYYTAFANCDGNLNVNYSPNGYAFSFVDVNGNGHCASQYTSYQQNPTSQACGSPYYTGGGFFDTGGYVLNAYPGPGITYLNCSHFAGAVYDCGFHR